MLTLEQQLSRVDLNLLVSLSVLLKERNVSRAAEQLYLSQSAMSRTLQRLRGLFDDPLFFRSSNGIIPTEKAQKLEQLLPTLLTTLEHFLANEVFSPATCDKTFSLLIPSLISHAFFLPLIKEVFNEAPHVQLTEFSAKTNPYKWLESGLYDFSIHIQEPIDPIFSATSLGKLPLVIFARKSHPLTKINNVSLADCLLYNFLDLNIERNDDIGFTSPVDSILLKQGLRRNIQLKSSQFSILIEVLKTTDTLLMGPSFLMDSASHKQDFIPVYHFEKTDENMVELFLLEHKRIKNSAPHQWLKNKILKQSFAKK